MAWTMMARVFILACLVLAAPLAVDAQQPARVARIGWLESTAHGM